ncbi:MAG TPA: hypothetical protein VMF06_07905 [Candidatus Limnocylindria bacterium]|nr:hypothetical protein [Candidatus Limnocylindria bacterium]
MVLLVLIASSLWCGVVRNGQSALQKSDPSPDNQFRPGHQLEAAQYAAMDTVKQLLTPILVAKLILPWNMDIAREESSLS